MKFFGRRGLKKFGRSCEWDGFYRGSEQSRNRESGRCSDGGLNLTDPTEGAAGRGLKKLELFLRQQIAMEE